MVPELRGGSHDDLDAAALLKAVKSVERILGRRPGISKGPRLIDIDILLYENVVVRTAGFTIPHERMNMRRFVLIPLRELAPAVRHPVSRRTVAEMLMDAPATSQVIRYKPPAMTRRRDMIRRTAH